MRILQIAPLKDRQTWCYMKAAFERLGHQVFVMETRPLGGMHSGAVDLIVCSRESNIYHRAFALKRAMEIPMVSWNVDAKSNVAGFGQPILDLFRVCDILYTVAEGNILQYRKLCPDTQVLWMPEAADPQSHNKFTLTEEDHEKYDCEVMFAGTINEAGLHRGRETILTAIGKRFNLKLWGQSNYVLNEEHSKACIGAKVCLSMTHSPNIHKYASARNYRIMGAGGYMLAMESSGFREMFPEGTCDTFREWDVEDCCRKIEVALEDAPRRRNFSDNAYKWVNASHLFEHRAEQILADVENL